TGDCTPGPSTVKPNSQSGIPPREERAYHSRQEGRTCPDLRDIAGRPDSPRLPRTGGAEGEARADRQRVRVLGRQPRRPHPAGGGRSARLPDARIPRRPPHVDPGGPEAEGPNRRVRIGLPRRARPADSGPETATEPEGRHERGWNEPARMRRASERY